MKVGIYLPNYSPDAGGGYTMERDMVDALVQFAPESRHQYTIFFVNASRQSMDELSKLGIQVVNVRTPKALSLVLKIRKVLRMTGLPHVLQAAVHKAGIHVMWFPTPIYIPVELPYIATMWDLQHRLQPWFPEVGSNGEWQLREIYYSEMIRRASYVVTGNETGMDEIKFFYQVPTERIKLLPHPTPSDLTRLDNNVVDTILEKYGIRSGFLFYPAQFWAHKNHVNLLMALKILNDEYGHDLSLVLVGSDKGNHQAYVRQQVHDLGLEKHVHILGFVPRRDLIALYQTALALIYPTFFGPENLPPLEALALGCPVIASSVPGAREQLGDCAILVDPSNPISIADGVKTLFEHPEKMIESMKMGRHRVSSWTSREFVRGIFSILDEFESIRRCWN